MPGLRASGRGSRYEKRCYRPSQSWESLVSLYPAVLSAAAAVAGWPAELRGAGSSQLDEMAGQPDTIGEVAAQTVPQGKIRGAARRSMTMAAALTGLMPEVGYGEILAVLFGDLAALPWQKKFAVPTATVLATWRRAAGPEPVLRLRQMVLAASAAEHQDHEGAPSRSVTWRWGPLTGR